MSRRQLTYVLGLLALAIWGSLLSGWMLSSDRSTAVRLPQTGVIEGTTRSMSADEHATPGAKQTNTTLPDGLPTVLNDPDPRVRIRALETWAQYPAGDLNPATYALVDLDESVRARAQELLEAVLAGGGTHEQDKKGRKEK